VPIRDEDGNVLDGVTIEDDGDKLGLQGVDNGRISFDHVRIPRENLLDRYATVGSDGLYQSPIENKNRRFFTTIGTLIQGRISVSGAALSATKSALAIAVRYANRRRQFGPPDSDDEALLMDYRVHQRRLLLPLATTYAIHFAQRELIADLHRMLLAEERDEHEQRVHAVVLAAHRQLREHHGQPPVAGGVADVVLARVLARGGDDELLRGQVVGGHGAEGLDVGAVPGLGHREAAGQVDGGQRRQVLLVVLLGAEAVHRAAEQAELHADLDEQAEVAVREGLEAGDGAAGVVGPAVLVGERARPGAGLGDLARPLEDEVAVGVAVQAVGPLEAEVAQDAPRVRADVGVRAVEDGLQRGHDVGGQGLEGGRGRRGRGHGRCVPT